jgi:cytochrome c biogenesis protein CcmG/thiol:disulfide interchange protein DsbE
LNLLGKIDRRLTRAGAVVAVLGVGMVSLWWQSEDERWPDIPLPGFADDEVMLTTASFTGEPAIINFWASWCVACRIDHPLLIDLAREGRVPVYGLNFRDDREDALRWLDYYGDPYDLSLRDSDGKLGSMLDIGALPVSLVIDASGGIHYRHLGALDSATIDTIILPLIEELRRKY